jgi:hypothetical protein
MFASTAISRSVADDDGVFGADEPQPERHSVDARRSILVTVVGSDKTSDDPGTTTGPGSSSQGPARRRGGERC